ncbi:MAG: hypothetical protein FK733_08215 [Asgard group archaeon]|nr:hypothetical protein [Asgard group archaeon]
MRKPLIYSLIIFTLWFTVFIYPISAEARNETNHVKSSECITNEQVGFNEDHHIKFIPESGNISGNCMHLAFEIRWSLRTISYDLYMAGPYLDNSSSPDYIHNWDDDWKFTKGDPERQLFLPDFTTLDVLNRTVKENGFYWFFIKVWEHSEYEKTSYSDYMILLTNYWFEWDGEKCYLDANIPILSLISLCGFLIIIKRKKNKLQ